MDAPDHQKQFFMTSSEKLDERGDLFIEEEDLEDEEDEVALEAMPEASKTEDFDGTAADNIKPLTAQERQSIDAKSFYSRHKAPGLAVDTSFRTGRQSAIDSPFSPKSRASFHKSSMFTFSRKSLEEARLEDIYEVEFNRDGMPTMITQDQKPASNYIRTTKYTLWTFLPVNLFHQFQRFYNIYFLLAAIFVLIEPSLDPVANVFPLCIVLAVTAVKDGVEDYKRYKSDKLANNQPYNVIRNAHVESILSQNIKPGDIVYARKGEKLPADILILSSSGEDGVCYVDTVELDGETSLKRRAAIGPTQSYNSPEAISTIGGYVECELPNEKLNLYEGVITLEIPNQQNQVFPLSLDNLLLRGTFLRNTEYIYGVVIYAGEDTKIFKNLKQTGLKFSTMERKLNRMVISIFIYNALLLVLSVIFSYVGPGHKNYEFPKAWYLPASVTSVKAGIATFMVFFVIYTFVIPISVFVSMELVRVIQAQFMIWDAEMRCRRTQKSMKVHNSNLNEDLGAIEYIFSDKTGTLTMNIMKLSHWYIDKMEFQESLNPGYLKQFYLTDAKEKQKRTLRMFARCVTLCHGTLPVYDENSDVPIYESPSPDEVALLEGMQTNDVLLLRRSKDQMVIKIFGEEETFEVLKFLDFTSDRKRMSIIVRDKDGRIWLFCKGADVKIAARLQSDPSDALQKTDAALTRYSMNGLRTLMMAYRELTVKEYEKFSGYYERAERALRNRERKVAKVSEIIEVRLNLLGCSAIEDKLQDEVPETIEYLLKCDIRVWLLTGDKQETAIKIGKSSKLISNASNIMKLNVKSGPDCSNVLDEFIEDVEARYQDDLNVLVVDGESLIFVLLIPELTQKFLKLGVRCRSVIACRVTPLQKALIVKIVKKELNKVTLSIGDGSNDVSMIQEAHVGVGIEGMEGAQAVRASDYSFGEFRCLRRLLAVHGRYSYLRMAHIIFYSFYKSIVLITVQFWFGFLNAWSGMALYVDQFLTLWNVLFTALPPICAASLDKDVDEDRIALYPQLYKAVKEGKFWNPLTEITWMVSAIYHSLVIYAIFVLTIGMGSLFESGSSITYHQQAYFAGAMVLITVTIKFLLVNRHWVWITYAAVFLSLALYVAVFYGLELVGYIWDGTFAGLHQLPHYYLGVILAVVACLIPDFLVKYFRRNYYPDDAMIVKEIPLEEISRLQRED